MSILLLTDGTEIKIEDGACLSDIPVTCTSAAEAAEIIDKLTVDNLKSVTFNTEDGEIYAEYENLVHVNTGLVPQEDGTVVVHIKLRSKTPIELRVDALEETQTDQDDAICELAEIIAGE